MSTFTYTPSYSVNLSTRPRVRSAQFGDGYTQRVADGINASPRIWSVTFNGDAARLDPIDTFLANEGGVTSFVWVPPTGVTGKWLCSEWSRNIAGYNDETLSATFTEVFGE